MLFSDTITHVKTYPLTIRYPDRFYSWFPFPQISIRTTGGTLALQCAMLLTIVDEIVLTLKHSKS